MPFAQHSQWKLGFLAGLAVALVAMIPQISLWAARGSNWQGSYAYTDPDELAYSAYLNSIISGNPRSNNPYLGGVEANASPSETFYSVQLFPVYALASLARILGLSASTVFILLIPLLAFASTLAIFWLVLEITGDEKTAALGALIILLSGVLASDWPIITENSYGGFPFLRRYIPAVPFPLFFVFCGSVLRAFTQRSKSAVVWSLAAGVLFVLLLYSYFYLWTAAGAWLMCLFISWFMARPVDRRHVSVCLGIFGVVAIGGLLPYFYLLSRRAETIDTAQALVLTHRPDLFRFVEIVGAVILAALIFNIRRRTIEWRSPAVLFALSCAIVPFVVFNQQIVSGHSLQPFHYEQFIVNYLVLIAVVLTDYLLWGQLAKRRALWIAFALVVGTATSLKADKVFIEDNLVRDGAAPVYKMIEEYRKRSGENGLAVFDRTLLAADAPTSSTVHTLWSPYLYTFGTTTTQENIERFYQFLYFIDVDRQHFEANLMSEVLFQTTLFGLPRVNRKLSQQFNPISAVEIEERVCDYARYVGSFSSQDAQRWPLSFVVVDRNVPFDFSNLDHWYVRDSGEPVGDLMIYRVQLRRNR